MRNNTTIQKKKRETEAPLPLAVSIIGLGWSLVVAWEVFTSHSIEILNVIAVASMLVMVLIIWIARKYKSAKK